MGMFDGFTPMDYDTRICSVTTGLVKENWDKDHPGMIKAEYFLGTKGMNVTGWIPVASPYASKACGSYMLPEIGSEVVIAFNMGDRNCPIVIGSLWNQKNTLPPETAVEKNTIKRFRTKGGCEVIFDDEEGKEMITVHTPGELALCIADEKQTITLADKDGKNGLKIEAKDGAVTLSADKKLTLSVGGKAMVTLDGQAKSVKLAADQIKIEAGQTLQMKGQNTKLEGSMLDIKAQSSLKAESGAMAQLKGAMVKIN